MTPRTHRHAGWLTVLVVLVVIMTLSASVFSVIFAEEHHAPPQALAAGTAPLVYQGGPVMPAASTYVVYWTPPQLQSGASSSMPSGMESLVSGFLGQLGTPGGTRLFRTLGQYYELDQGRRVYPKTSIPLDGVVIDHSPYPNSVGRCGHETNCMTQAQIQDHLESMMGSHGWTPSLDHVFLVYLAPNEDACDAACAVTSKSDSWCGTHYDAPMGSSRVIYGVFITDTADQSCDNFQGSGENPLPSPNHSSLNDSQVSSTAHELAEAITDPEADNTGWTTLKGAQSGSEIADVCESNFDPLRSDGANQVWGAHRYQIQELWDNAFHRCVQRVP